MWRIGLVILIALAAVLLILVVKKQIEERRLEPVVEKKDRRHELFSWLIYGASLPFGVVLAFVGLFSLEYFFPGIFLHLSVLLDKLFFIN